MPKARILSKCRFDFVGEYFNNKKSSDPKVLQINKKSYCNMLLLFLTFPYQAKKPKKSAFAMMCINDLYASTVGREH